MPDKLSGRLTPERRLDGTLNNKGTLRGVLGGTGAVVTYASLPDKPSINDVTLVGNKTTSDLNINYNDLKNLPSIPDVGEIDERLDNLEGNITSLGGRVTTAEGNITDLQGDTSALDTRLTTAEGDITSLGGRLTTVEGNITSLGGRVTTAEGNITDLQGDTSALDTRLTTAEGNITSLDGRVTTNEGDILDLQGDMSQAQSDITQLNSSITNLATIESAQSSTIAVGGTYQIPSNILNHKLILFEIRRQGYGGAMLFEKNNLLLIDNGFSIRVTANDYYTFKCSPTGLMTLVAKSSGVSDVFIFVHGLF